MKLNRTAMVWILAVALLLLLPAGVMLGTWLAMPWLSSNADQSALQRYGLIGDLFGFAGAVFAGIGLIGVALALAFETIDRKRARRPFVIINLPEDGVEIRRGEWASGTLDVRIRIAGQLANDSQDPALNVIAKSAGLPGLGDGASRHVLPGPLAAGSASETTLVSRLHGADAEAFLRKMKSGERHQIDLESNYQSLNGSKWMTTMQVNLHCGNSADQARLSDALNQRSGVFIDGDTDSAYGSDAVVLRAEVVEGSWKQDPI